MNDKLSVYDIQSIINTILNNMKLFWKCGLEKTAYSELIRLHKQSIYLIEQMNERTE